MEIYTTIIIEFILVVSSILLLFKFRSQIGLAPLYILLGAIQFLQANIGSSFSFTVFDDYVVYPGSIILFSGVLFAVLLVYIKEGVISARALIIGIVISNVIMVLMFQITNTQQLIASEANDLSANAQQIIKINFKYFLSGTAILILDFLLLVILYQYLILKFKKLPYFLVLLLSLVTILIFDALLFNFTLFYGTPTFKTSLVSHFVGKSIAAILYSAILYSYIKFIDTEKAKSTFIANQSREVFSIIKYRKQYENLKVEKKRVEKRLTSQLETSLQNISDGFVSLDNNWCFTFINKKAAEFLGQSPERLIGKHMWAEFPEGIGLPAYETYRKAVETQKTISSEDYYELLDKWFENRVYPSADGLTIYFTDITEQKKVEEDFINSELLFRRLTSNAPVGIFQADKEGAVNYVNEEWLDYVGMSYDEALGFGWSNAIHPDDKERVVKAWQQYVITGGDFTIEFRFQDKKNSIKWISSKTVETFDAKSNLYGYIGVSLDISERKEAEEQIKRSEKYLDNIINNIGDPVFVKDDQSRLMLVNDSFCQLFNLSKEDAIGKTLAENVSLEERDNFLKVDKQVISTGVENIKEETLTLPGNETKIISTRKTRFIDSEGNKFLIGIIRDITERKKAEKEILHLGIRNTRIIETLLDGFILADTTGKILDANPSYVSMIGYTLEELLTMNINQLEVALNQTEIEERINEMVSKGFARFSSNHKKKDGELIDLDVSTFTMQVNEHPVVAAFVKDITEQKKAEIEIKESIEKYSKAFNSNVIGKAIINNEKIIIEVNDALANIVGFKRENMLGKTAQEIGLFNFDDPKNLENEALIWREFNENGFVSNIELKYLMNDGKELFILLALQALQLNNEDHVMITIIDITEKKNVENELDKHRNNLEELVEKRTAEVNSKNNQLERMNKLFVGRELKMKELKNIIKELQTKNDD